jgi:hypothetical protein
MTLGVAAAGTAINLAIYGVASALGYISDDVITVGSSTLNAAQVVVASTAGIVAAAVVFAIIGRFTAHPGRWFRPLAASMFVASLASPGALAGVTVSMALTLMLMHFVDFALAYIFLPRTLRPQEDGDR